MKQSWDEIKANAVVFSKHRKDAHNEESEAQGFEIDFLRVFSVDDPMRSGEFESRIPLSGGKTGYIYIPI